MATSDAERKLIATFDGPNVIVQFGRELSVEQIAWLVREATMFGGATHYFAHREWRDQVIFGSYSHYAMYNIRVEPVTNGPYFVPGSPHREVILTKPSDLWGSVITNHVDYEDEYLDGRQQFVTLLCRALRTSTVVDRDFPELDVRTLR